MANTAEPLLQTLPAEQGDALPLSPDALHVICSHLEFADLLSASTACRQLHAAASAPQLWERLCRRRWAGSLNTSLFRGDARRGGIPDYRQLFLQNNGWAWPRLAVQRYAGGLARRRAHHALCCLFASRAPRLSVYVLSTV